MVLVVDVSTDARTYAFLVKCTDGRAHFVSLAKRDLAQVVLRRARDDWYDAVGRDGEQILGEEVGALIVEVLQHSE